MTFFRSLVVALGLFLSMGYIATPQAYAWEGEKEMDTSDCDQIEEPDRTITGCTELIEHNPSNWVAFNNRSYAHMRLKQFDKAIADAEMILKLDPELYRAHYHLGNAYLGKGDNEKAINHYAEYLKHHKDYSWAFNGIAKANLRLGRPAEALLHADSAVEFLKEDSGDTSGIYSVRGLAHEKLGQNEEAIADYRKAISINPDHLDSIDGLQRLGALLE